MIKNKLIPIIAWIVFLVFVIASAFIPEFPGPMGMISIFACGILIGLDAGNGE